LSITANIVILSF